jgi:hypothetical protein
MAYTQDQINTLKTAIANGQLRVRHGDTEVLYRSLDEMMRLLSLMQSDVTTRTRTTVAAFRSVR